MTPCTHPRCSNPSIVSEHGRIAGRYEPQCLQHALESARRTLEDAQTRVSALELLGGEQMELKLG